MGKVIAYNTISFDFGSDTGYTLYGCKTKFGYVEDHRDESPTSSWKRLNEPSYILHQLLSVQRRDKHFFRFIVNNELNWAPMQTILEVRNITQQEASCILNAIKNKEAKFDYVDEEIDLNVGLYKIILQWLEQAADKQFFVYFRQRSTIF